MHVNFHYFYFLKWNVWIKYGNSISSEVYSGVWYIYLYSVKGGGGLQQIEKRNFFGVNTRSIHFLLAIRSKHLQCFDIIYEIMKHA